MGIFFPTWRVIHVRYSYVFAWPLIIGFSSTHLAINCEHFTNQVVLKAIKLVNRDVYWLFSASWCVSSLTRFSLCIREISGLDITEKYHISPCFLLFQSAVLNVTGSQMDVSAPETTGRSVQIALAIKRRPLQATFKGWCWVHNTNSTHLMLINWWAVPQT